MKKKDTIRFITMVRMPEEIPPVRLLIDSIRSWGGALADSHINIFNVNPTQVSCKELEDDNIGSIILDVPDNLRKYYYGDKVFACARAEELFPEASTLIWIDPACLIVNPPLLYQLDISYDCAVRPVHIKNVGLLADEPLDMFWEKIYKVVGTDDTSRTVETFVGKKLIRAYYNTHALSVKPAAGLFGEWLHYFDLLIRNEEYQQAACNDEWHKIFLHQAVLSALIAAKCNKDRVRILPPEYNYPYNLQDKIPSERRASALNDLVSIAYENRTLDPDYIKDIEIHEPLRGWLDEYKFS